MAATIKHAAEGMASVDKVYFPFLKLPLELREMVYTEYIFDLGIQYQVKNQWDVISLDSRREQVRRLLPPFSMTCLTLRAEYTAMEKRVLEKHPDIQHELLLAYATKTTKKPSTQWSELLSKLHEVRSCTIRCRLDWDHTYFNVEDIVMLMFYLTNAEQIKIEIHCPSSTPIYYPWVSSTKWLQDYLERRLCPNGPQSGLPEPTFRKTLKKISLCLHGQLYAFRYPEEWTSPLGPRRFFFLSYQRTTDETEWRQTSLRSRSDGAPAYWGLHPLDDDVVKRCQSCCHVRCPMAVWRAKARRNPEPRNERFEWQ